MKSTVVLGFILLFIVVPTFTHILQSQYEFKGQKEAQLMEYKYNGSNWQIEVSVYRSDKQMSQRYIMFYNGNDSTLLKLFENKSNSYTSILPEVKRTVEYSGNFWCVNRVNLK